MTAHKIPWRMVHFAATLLEAKFPGVKRLDESHTSKAFVKL
jgi:hypothetical protein